MIIGFFLVRTIPLPTYEVRNSDYTIVNEVGPVVDLEASTSVTPLLINEDPPPFTDQNHGDSHIQTSLELSPTRSSSPGMGSTGQSRNHAPRPSFGSAARMLDMAPNISGRRLWMSSDFLLFFVIMSLRKSFIACLSSFNINLECSSEWHRHHV